MCVYANEGRIIEQNRKIHFIFALLISKESVLRTQSEEMGVAWLSVRMREISWLFWIC